jgi:hypothetical protein
MTLDPKNFADAATSSKQRYLIARSGVELSARKRNLRRFKVPLTQKIKLNRKWFFLSAAAGLGIAGAIAIRGGYLVQGAHEVMPPKAIASQTVVSTPRPIVPEFTKTLPAPVKDEVLIKLEQVKTPIARQKQQTAAPKAAIKTSATTSASSVSTLIKPTVEVKPEIKSLENLQRAKDSKDTNELGFKVSAGYTVVGIPADGVVMIKKDGEIMQQMIKVGGRFPDGEELRSASSATKQIETNAKKYIAH